MKRCKFGFRTDDGICKLHNCTYTPNPKCQEELCEEQSGGESYFENDDKFTQLDAIKIMSADEIAQWLLIDFPKFHKKAYDYAWKNRKTGEFSRYYREHMAELLNSQHTKGATLEN